MVSIHSLSDGFYRPVAGATGFPCPIWSLWPVLTRHFTLTKGASYHCDDRGGG